MHWSLVHPGPTSPKAPAAELGSRGCPGGPRPFIRNKPDMMFGILIIFEVYSLFKGYWAPWLQGAGLGSEFNQTLNPKPPQP